MWIAELILFKIQRRFNSVLDPQPYLDVLYKALFALGYYGMMRVSELTFSPHVTRACNVHLAKNKKKVLAMLYTSNTHGQGSRPQKIKITANESDTSGGYHHRNFCPFKLLKNYIAVQGNYNGPNDQFFIFRDGSPVKAEQAWAVLHQALKALGLDPSMYGIHSLRIGRTMDMAKFHFSIDEIRRVGRWRSNVVYKYIRHY